MGRGKIVYELCTKIEMERPFLFGSTPNNKSWTAIARLLFLIRDLLHFVNSIASKRTIDYKKENGHAFT